MSPSGVAVNSGSDTDANITEPAVAVLVLYGTHVRRVGLDPVDERAALDRLALVLLDVALARRQQAVAALAAVLPAVLCRLRRLGLALRRSRVVVVTAAARGGDQHQHGQQNDRRRTA
jgi:hypothetical protein